MVIIIISHDGVAQWQNSCLLCKKHGLDIQFLKIKEQMAVTTDLWETDCNFVLIKILGLGYS